MRKRFVIKMTTAPMLMKKKQNMSQNQFLTEEEFIQLKMAFIFIISGKEEKAKMM